MKQTYLCYQGPLLLTDFTISLLGLETSLGEALNEPHSILSPKLTMHDNPHRLLQQKDFPYQWRTDPYRIRLLADAVENFISHPHSSLPFTGSLLISQLVLSLATPSLLPRPPLLNFPTPTLSIL